MLTGSTNSFKTVVEVAQVKQIVFYINVRNSAYDFSVKLSSWYVGILTVAVLAVGFCNT